MSNVDPVVRTAERLLAVDWSGDLGWDHVRSRVQLMREYLRRAALWAEAVDCTDRWPFFDIAACVDPSVRADGVLEDRLSKNFERNPVWPDVKDTSIWALRWAALRAAPGSKLPDLEDPFEPLILLYERGGGFNTAHGRIEINLVALPPRDWSEHLSSQPVVALDRSTLDKLDDRSSSQQQA